jgi:alkylation response protein AidB-like acyl-CoA dehydrogenase
MAASTKTQPRTHGAFGNSPASAAKDLAPAFSARSAQHDAEGRLADETVAALKEANLFGLMAPAELGGLEASPCEILETLEEVSRADGSTGWVLMTCAFATGLAGAYLSDVAAAEVFGNGMPIIAGAGAPQGRARMQDGGYLFSGRWSYGSGILHATHTHNGGFIIDPSGEVRSDLGHNIFVAPIAAAVLDTEWNVLGLRGTASVDYAIDNCYLPVGYEHPTVRTVQRRGGPTYQIGMAGLSSIAHSGFCLGTGRRVLDELVLVARAKAGQSSLIDSESFQEGYGVAEAKHRAARALVFECWRAVEKRIAAGQAVERPHIAATQIAMCHMAAASTEAAEFAYKAAGGVSLRDGPLQRAFRDTLAGRQHVRVSASVMRTCARELLIGAKVG